MINVTVQGSMRLTDSDFVYLEKLTITIALFSFPNRILVTEHSLEVENVHDARFVGVTIKRSDRNLTSLGCLSLMESSVRVSNGLTLRDCYTPSQPCAGLIIDAVSTLWAD
eukprot:PhF_6_TR15178/c0_g1_i1/m.23843